MKRAMIRCVLTGVLLVMIATCASGVPTTTSPRRSTAVETREPYRIIGEWDGKVAVFLPKEKTPESVYDARVRSFPDDEQRKLRDGIEAADEDSLRRLLEDYLS
ncbi:MAG: hypothetical protein IKV35_03170 [Clostridia bacterium]|nr:hypothetical protein [Clostridia bacterium]